MGLILIHLQGPPEALDTVAEAVLGLSLKDLQEAFK